MPDIRIKALLLALVLALTVVTATVAPAEDIDAIQAMLDDLNNPPEAGSDSETPPEEPAEAPSTEEGGDPAATPADAAPGTGYENYVLLEGFIPATLNGTVLVQVPDEWGNNAGANQSLTSYSPVNGSGAISPNAGTISTNWFSVGSAAPADVLKDYAQRIGSKKVVSGLQAADVTVDGQPGSLLTYGMDVGSNHFDVKVMCFAYQGQIYSVDLTQGSRSEKDYTPVFDAVGGSLAIYDDSWDIEALVREAESRATPTAEPSVPTAKPPAPTAEPPVPTAEPPVSTGNDLGSFTYIVGGHEYAFPTPLGDMADDALPIDRTGSLPYDLSPSAADNGGVENPLVNTQYYAYDDPANMELVGITNMAGAPAPLDDGIVTALVDTSAGDIRLTLPGGVAVGSPESAIVGAFPEFSGRALDGLAGFRGNELLYACNVRSDGSHGYALIRNDPPFRSALTLVCANGEITEINFECLGEALTEGVFL